MNALPMRTASPSGHSGGYSSAGTHVPVLLNEVLETLSPTAGGVFLDGTFGGGGYTRAILDTAEDSTVWAIDRDPAAITRGAALAARYRDRLHLIQGNFSQMASLLTDRGINALDGIVLDIGVSSFQIDDPDRGFSFRTDGPLDMRMAGEGTSAADLIARLPEAEIANILYELGEERKSRQIARAIVNARAEEPITTTGRLASIIRCVVPPDRSGIDPATRSFQALRIAVNDELGELERALQQATNLLKPGGRLVIVSFHSLEDRIVKRFMNDAAGHAPSPSRYDPRGLVARTEPRFRLITSKAVRPGAAEQTANPRSRSARLRAIECLRRETTP
ncbi:S-adenosyl-methyltransferase mraW [Granulibacter bethesdensis]|uniref:Ribosomal RNA small subunit methyltransferase H n=2 Tax=Granulibacter bethesdensis TaxID=364410 RepID=A0AAC9P857_9PROT|nr:S-adenosyl-methyltransferase mraW [Granulibacter bethesdensis]APH61252.1 S-adenosyl-methyltransferase mraW [Granulibacter bethesdensis]